MQTTISCAVLILAVVVVRAVAMHKLTKNAFKALWGVAVLRILLPFEVSSPLSFYSIMGRLVRGDVVSKGGHYLPSYAVLPSTADRLASDVVNSSTQISPLTIIWVVGVVVCLAFFGTAYFRCTREFAKSLPVDDPFIADWVNDNKGIRNIKVRQSDRVNTPLTYGVFKPIILLPKTIQWDNHKQLEYILAHELVHIKRFDVLYKLLLTLSLCIHWFNPMVWVMYILANRDIELSCDEQVVFKFGEGARSYYAMTLIDMEEKKSRLTPLCNNFSKNSIEERITAIMKIKKTSLAGLVITIALVAGTTTVFATTATKPEDIANKVLNEVKGTISNSEQVVLTEIDDETGYKKVSINNGKNWISEKDYKKMNGKQEIVWWTYDGYKAFMEKEIADTQALVGKEGTGYYDKDGKLNGFTQDDVNRVIDYHKKTLEEIKNGAKISKEVNGRSDIIVSGVNGTEGLPVKKGFLCSIVKDDDTVAVFGPYDTKEDLIAELIDYCKKKVSEGSMTQKEADKIISGQANIE